MSEEMCPCKSGKTYADCCRKIIEGAPAPTAEALMRARYSAYAKGAVDFLINSVHSSQRAEDSRENIKQWSEEAEWTGMEVLRAEQGGLNDDEGVVEFVAHYNVQGKAQEHHEVSTFCREDGKWVFYDGKMVGQKPYVRESAKIRPNDPCPCGSGKKYKKCCGR